MNVGPFVPAEGDTLYECRGGPYDKMGIHFNSDNAPVRMFLDGHLYLKVEKTFEEYAGEDADQYMNDPEEMFITEYHYVRKVFDSPPMFKLEDNRHVPILSQKRHEDHIPEGYGWLRSKFDSMSERIKELEIENQHLRMDLL